MIKKIILVCLLLISENLLGQQDPRFTLFNFNYTNINPAATGSRDKLVASLLHRYQWVGYSHAPNTTTFSFEIPFYPLRSAFSVNFMNDNIGILKKSLVSINYACIANITSTNRLAFGAQLSYNQTNVNYSSLTTDPDNVNLVVDNALNNGNNLSSSDIQVGLGIYYYTRKWKIGISVPSINTFKYYGLEERSPKTSHGFFMAGYNLVVNEKFFYNPRVLVKYTNGSPIQLDFYNQVVINRKFGPGFSLRSGESISFLMSYLPKSQFVINYSYDLVSLNKIRSYQYGSHEISLIYQLPLKYHERHKERAKQARKRDCVDYDDQNKEKKKLQEDILKIYYSLD